MKDSVICPTPGCGLMVHWNKERCPNGHDAGFPNIREVNCRDEQEALRLRYEDALNDAKNRNAYDRLLAFERAVQSESHIVINARPDFLYTFLNDPRVLYTNYKSQVRAETRLPPSINDAADRDVVDALLFPEYAERIIYGALSLNGSGLISYGKCCFVVSDILAENKATLLEENSYRFIFHTHRINRRSKIPHGYRSIWKDRQKLAVAKLSKRIEENTSDDSFPDLVLRSSGDRKTDDFIEVHIYGGFDCQVVEAVEIPRPSSTNDTLEQAYLMCIRDWTHRNGKGYTEI